MTENKAKSFLNFLVDTAKIVLLSLLIVVPIRYFVAQPFFVRGASMELTYEHGDYLIVDQISYYFNAPTRGEVVIFRFPENASQFFIKRIIALPGETIAINDGIVTIKNAENPDGFVLNEPYLKNSANGNLEVTLQENTYFLMGDNRGASYDSRSWGPLPEDFIVGRVFLRAWPFDSFGKPETPNY
jgi:signal peptidase I